MVTLVTRVEMFEMTGEVESSTRGKPEEATLTKANGLQWATL